jgi:sugar phosphate isomerase/epimerase
VAIGAKTVSLWSGVAEKGIDSKTSRNHLVMALEEVLADACGSGISIGFEPEPGMEIESLADWRWLREQVTGSALGLTLDLGHLAVTESVPLEVSMASVIEDVIHVHVDDCKDGVHQHLEPGAGEIDFDPLLQLLVEQGYSGLALVELSRDSHRAPELIERTIRYLHAVEAKVNSKTGNNSRKGTV